MAQDWAGLEDVSPPEKYDCAIDTTPAGEVIPFAMQNLRPGGRLVINATRKSTLIPQMDYAKYLWHEKEIKSVANVTRQDAEEFLPLAAKAGIKPVFEEFALADANDSLLMLKDGKLRAAAVLRII